MTDTQEPGFVVDGRHYPMPTRFRSLDGVLIREVTGLSWDEFAEQLETPGQEQLLGFLAVAIWQGNPDWKRDRVVRFMSQLDMEQITTVGDSGDSGDSGDAGPPAPSAADAPPSNGAASTDLGVPASAGAWTPT